MARPPAIQTQASLLEDSTVTSARSSSRSGRRSTPHPRPPPISTQESLQHLGVLSDSDYERAARSTVSRRSALRPPPLRLQGSLQSGGTDSDPEAGSSAAARPPPTGRSKPTLSRRWSISAVADGATLPSSSRLTRAARDMAQVLPQLHVGAVSAARSRAVLLSYGITHVLNCCTMPNAHEGRADSPKYLQLSLRDSHVDMPRMGSAIRDGVQFIHAALQDGGTVLVHCHRGISRSCTLVIAYIIWAQRKPLEAAFDFVRAARPQCDPNLSFMCALKDWELQVLAEPPPQPIRPRQPGLLRSRSVVQPQRLGGTVPLAGSFRAAGAADVVPLSRAKSF